LKRGVENYTWTMPEDDEEIVRGGAAPQEER
jgi:hypothetical protein